MERAVYCMVKEKADVKEDFLVAKLFGLGESERR